MSSCSAASRREAPPSTRAITRMRMSAEYAFGIVRPPDESMPPDSPTYRSLGTLRFYSARTCSRAAEQVRQKRGRPGGTGFLHHDFVIRLESTYREITGKPGRVGWGPFAHFVDKFLEALRRKINKE